MARSSLTDLLKTYAFWVVDVAPISPTALPILTPIFGFSAVTAPEIQAEVYEVKEGNSYFKRKMIKGANIPNITLERGVVFYDSDFYRWIMMALSGDMSNSLLKVGRVNIEVGGLTPRRSLMIVQFFTHTPLKLPEGSDPIVAAAIQGSIAAAGASLAGGNAGGALGAAAKTAALGALSQAFGPFEFAARLPAKAWMLYGVLPVRYKAGTDFDARVSAISLQQLELAVEAVEEVSLVA